MTLESGTAAGACHRCGLAWRYCPFCGEEQQQQRLDHPQKGLVATTKPCVSSLAERCPSICWSDAATLTGKKSKAAGCKSSVQNRITTTATTATTTTAGSHRNPNVTDHSLLGTTVTGTVRAHGAREGRRPSAKAVFDTTLSDGAAVPDVLQHLLQVAREEWKAAAGRRPLNCEENKKGEPCDARDEESDARSPKEKQQQQKKDAPVHPGSSCSSATAVDRDDAAAAPWGMHDGRWQLSGFELFCWEESTRHGTDAACQHSALSSSPLPPPRVSQGRLTMAARRALAQKWLTASLSLKSTYESLALQWRSMVSDEQHGQKSSRRSSSFSFPPPQAPPPPPRTTTTSTAAAAAAGFSCSVPSPPAATVARSFSSYAAMATGTDAAMSNLTTIIPASEEASILLLTRNKRARGGEEHHKEEREEERDQAPNGDSINSTINTTTANTSAITTTAGTTTGVEEAQPRSRAPPPPRLYREIRGVVTSYGIFYGEQRRAGVGVKRIRDMWESMSVECKHRYDEEAASRRYRIEAARLQQQQQQQQQQEQEQSLKQK